MIRVTSPASDRLTRMPRTMARAEDRARWVALVFGEAVIERREKRGEWETVATWRKQGGAVTRRTGR